MSPWKTVQTSLLVTTFGGVLLVLGKSILYPNAGVYRETPFVFPATVPLPDWQPLASSSLNNHKNELSGKHYRYVQKDLPLDIEMRYLTNIDGDVNAFIKQYAPHSSSEGQLRGVVRQQEGVGFHRLFVEKGRVYLSACINSNGGSTVTSKQFRQNRNTHDLNFNRLLVWLLARGKLRDERCLWAHLSVPLKNSSEQETYPILEKAWVSWYQWWSPRFPKP